MASKIRVLTSQSYSEAHGMVSVTNEYNGPDQQAEGSLFIGAGADGPQKGHAVITLKDKNGAAVASATANLGVASCYINLTPAATSALGSSAANTFSYAMASAEFSSGSIEVVMSGKLGGYAQALSSLTVGGDWHVGLKNHALGNGVFITTYKFEVYEA